MKRHAIEERARKQRVRRNPTLPDDVVIEILQRLPAKCLLRYKYVCKFWYGLIRSSNFISTHYNFHKNNKLSLLCFSYDYQRKKPVFSFHLSENSVDLNMAEFPYEYIRPEIAGCSYGLVCISLFGPLHNRFVLWNPAAGDERLIDMNDKCFYGSLVSSGFYFDLAGNSHKVVRITTLWKPSPRGGNAACIDAFTLRENSWKQKHLVIPYEIPTEKSNISEVTRTERYMYWILGPDEVKYILCFDMVSEVFRRIEFPCLKDRPYDSTHLADYKGSLAMFALDERYNYPVQYSFGVWVLTGGCDGGDKKQSWARQLTLRPPFDGVQTPRGFFAKGGADLVFVCAESGCFLWNSVSGETTEVTSDGYGHFQQFCSYSESLASVF